MRAYGGKRDGFYYVDKTGLIEQLLERLGEVKLLKKTLHSRL